MNYKDLTKNDLLEHIKDTFGVELPEKTTKAELIAFIEDKSNETSIDAIGAGSATEGNEDKTPKSVVINIPDDSESEKINYHVVGVNGKNYQIQKGKDVTVPFGVFDVLNNAVETFYRPVTGEGGKVNLVQRERKRINFSVIKMVY